MPQQTSTFEACSWVAILQVGGLGEVWVNCFPKAIATWHGRESNQLPPDLESDALTTLPRSVFTCPVFPPGLQCGNSSWTIYNNNCYYVSAISGDTATASWFEARLACMDMGADLASISGDDENGYITSVISAHPQNAFWIGLNELDLDSYKWTDMQPLSYVNWAKNEPNDAYGAEKCVEIVSNVQRCYHVGGTDPSQRKNYGDSITACGQMVHKATLASIHSNAEESKCHNYPGSHERLSLNLELFEYVCE
ncbi:macrophage mannose receptor 1-like [Elysia marginata]|uniref:Macrophage mannose receptor 1-like n=1 Tax=Elysia marginata TaxID=1093978 RepID=A0AAV4ETV1_9GAST|nr:macrophage mannose receptor 1-like [Elysia marginata]